MEDETELTEPHLKPGSETWLNWLKIVATQWTLLLIKVNGLIPFRMG